MAEEIIQTETALYNSNICRLCAEECHNGINIYSNEQDEVDIISLINHYLPLKVNY